MSGARVLARCGRHQYWPQWTALVWLSVGIFILTLTAGCDRDLAAADKSRNPPVSQGTLTGSVRGPENVAAVGGRVVEVVNLETNERLRSTTNNAGGFSFRVKPGKYRVELS